MGAPGVRPLFLVPARGCCGHDDNRLKSRLRKGQREVEGARAGSAGLKGGAPPSELEGVSCPRTVTSHQGRSGQEPSAWSCPPRPNGDTSEASRCVIRRQGGLESALGRAARTLQPRRRPTVWQDSQCQASGLGATRTEGPRSLQTGSTWTGTEGRNPRWPLAPPGSLSPRRQRLSLRASLRRRLYAR